MMVLDRIMIMDKKTELRVSSVKNAIKELINDFLTA